MTCYSRYRHLAVEQVKPAPTELQVAAIETLLGANLPASFRDFLRVANGGYLPYSIDVPTGSGKTESLCFCSIFSADERESGHETFVGELRSAREYAIIPQGGMAAVPSSISTYLARGMAGWWPL